MGKDYGQVYEFGKFRLDPNENLLSKDGAPVLLKPKPFRTLVHLVENSGHLVEKSELIDVVWGDSFVEEATVSKCIWSIRTALGDGSKENKFIQTVPKRGYRFVAKVSTAERGISSVLPPVIANNEISEIENGIPSQIQTPEDLHAQSSASAALKKTLIITAAAFLFLVLSVFAVYRYKYDGPGSGNSVVSSLAVLPMKASDANDNYIGLGIADAIIRQISQTGTVAVRPTSAVRRYLDSDADAREIGRELGTDAVLEGTMQRAGERFRVSVNLVHVSDGSSFWADRFDVESSDIFAIQDRVAAQVATNLKLRLDTVQQKRFATNYVPNAIAYEYYLRAVYSFDQRGFDLGYKTQNETTIGLFKKSIEADPNYALAHAQLAYAYAWMAVYIDPSQQTKWVELAKQQIGSADALDPQLAETHIARHHILLSASEGFQLESAIREVRIAQQLDPNIGSGDLAADFLHLGLEEAFEREMRRTLEIEPTSEFNKNMFGILYMNAKRYDDWIAFRREYFDGQPDAAYLLGTGRLDEAQEQIEKALAKSPNDAYNIANNAILMAKRGHHRDAQRVIPILLSKLKYKVRGYHHQTYSIACVYALAGNSAEAVKWLRETAMSGFPSYPLLERDHELDRIRNSPEFTQFMDEMKTQYERLRREFAE